MAKYSVSNQASVITVLSSDDGTVIVDDQPGDTPEEKFDAAVQAADDLHPPSSGRARLITARASQYRFTTPGYKLSCNGISSPTGAKRETHLVFENPTQGQTLLEISGTFGSTCRGIWVSSGSQGIESEASNFRDVVAFNFDSVSSLEVSNCDARLFGMNSVGFDVTTSGQNNESCTFRNINALASMPLRHQSGDNMSYINYDLTCGIDPSNYAEGSNPQVDVGGALIEENLSSGVDDPDWVWAAIQGGPTTTLDHVLFTGSTQRGHHSVYFDTEFVSGTKSVGNLGMFLHHRDEQGFSNGGARMVLRFRRDLGGGLLTHGQERVLFTGVRTSSVDILTGGAFPDSFFIEQVLGFEDGGGNFLTGGAASGSQGIVSIGTV